MGTKRDTSYYKKFRKVGWDIAYGCSGTIKSVNEVCRANGLEGRTKFRITRQNNTFGLQIRKFKGPLLTWAKSR